MPIYPTSVAYEDSRRIQLTIPRLAFSASLFAIAAPSNIVVGAGDAVLYPSSVEGLGSVENVVGAAGDVTDGDDDMGYDVGMALVSVSVVRTE